VNSVYKIKLTSGLQRQLTYLLIYLVTLSYSVTACMVNGNVTRSPAIAEGPRDAGVPVEIW